MDFIFLAKLLISPNQSMKPNNLQLKRIRIKVPMKNWVYQIGSGFGLLVLHDVGDGDDGGGSRAGSGGGERGEAKGERRSEKSGGGSEGIEEEGFVIGSERERVKDFGGGGEGHCGKWKMGWENGRKRRYKRKGAEETKRGSFEIAAFSYDSLIFVFPTNTKWTTRRRRKPLN